jgi:squalene synthase HpnC
MGAVPVPAPTAARPARVAPGRERGENFPVALRLLPAAARRDLLALYRFARLVDDLGDDPARSPAERSAALAAFEADLRLAWSDHPRQRPATPELARLADTVRARALPMQPFLDLVEANRQDQERTRYSTYADLLAYCALSANPVGRLVLGVAGALTPARVAGSDAVCTALQLLEHCQDVGEDLSLRDRVYLPQEDLHAYGVDETQLRAETAGAQLRRLLATQTARARALLAGHGPRLVASLHGWPRLAVAGYVAGGLATADALARAEYDVLGQAVRPSRTGVARHAAALYLGARA